MRSLQTVAGLLLAIGTGTAVGYGLSGLSEQAASSAPAKSSPASAALPKDVYPESGFRLPFVKRENLDAYGKQVYDSLADPNRRGSLAGLQGPTGIRLHSPKVAELSGKLNELLRFDTGLEGSLRELAILVTAREMNSQFEWTAHEPAAQKEGLEQRTIDIVKYRRSATGLGEKQTVIIEFGRQLFGLRKVTPETFARALKLFGPQGLVNLVSLMTNYSSTASLLAAFDMQLLPGQKPLLPMP